MRPTLAVLAAVAVVGCQDVALPPQVVPGFAISDGPHGGNPLVFFLPPLVPQPSFSGVLADDAAPSVVICTLVNDACGTVVMTFGPDAVSLTEDHFEVQWQTGTANGISTSLDYRIELRVQDLVLGFRDVDPKATPQEVPKQPETLDLYAFRNGSTIPIKFRLERGFLCAALEFDDEAGECNEGNLRDGLIVQIPETGTGVSVPAQSFDQFVAIVVEPCPDGQNLPVDLPTFGTCFEVRSSPALAQTLSPQASVFVCEEPGLDERQEGLIRLHKSDALDGSAPVVALPNAPGLCPTEVARGPDGGNVFARALRVVGDGFLRIIGPRPLEATLLDRGLAGLTGGFSFFQFALPAKMEIHIGDGQAAPVGQPVAIPPTVFVSDLDGFPVAGATVRFEVVEGGGTVTPLTVLTNANGAARVTSWVLGAPGLNRLRAFGRGIADPVSNGPRPIFDPFTPIQEPNPFDEVPVQLLTGEVFFLATGIGN